MEAIEKATGKSITRIETNDLDVMEEVRTYHRLHAFTAPHAIVWRGVQQMKKALK